MFSSALGGRLGAGLRLPFMPYALLAATIVLGLRPVVAAGESGIPSSLLLFLGAVVLNGAVGGRQLGLLTALLGSLANVWFAFSTLAFSSTSLVAGSQVGLFVAVALAVSVLAEQRRRAAEQRQYYADLLDAMSRDPTEGVCALDPLGRITFLNLAAEQLLERRESDLVGQSLHAAVHHASCSQPCPLDAALQPADMVRTAEDTITTGTGSKLHIDYTISPIMRSRQVQGTIFTFRDTTYPKRTLHLLRASEERYRSLVEMSPDGIMLVDHYGYIVMANQQTARLYGYTSPDELHGKRTVELVVAEDRLRALEHDRVVLADGAVARNEYLALRRDGSSFPVEIRASLTRWGTDGAVTLIHVCSDISERRHQDDSLRATQSYTATQHAATIALAQSATLGEAALNLLRVICENTGWDVGILWLRDTGDSILHCHSIWSQPSLDVAGFEDVSRQLSLTRGEDLPGRAWLDAGPIWIADIMSHAHFPRALVASQTGLHSALCVPVLAAGTVLGVLEFFSCEQQERNPELIQVVDAISGQFSQFAERKEAEQALAYQARHDALTDLPNRVLFQERVARALGMAQSAKVSLVLLLMDLDRFKEVNDTLGHHYGDLLLQQVALRLRAALRESDTVARLGGDEFAVLLPATDLTGAREVAEKMLRQVEQPYRLEEQHVDVGGSIGLAVYPEHGKDAHTLLQRADIAMYAAKRGRIGYTVYSAEHDENSPDRLTLMAELHQAIEQKRLLVHYQPKMNLDTGRIESVEALVRWHHPDRGTIPPDDFIPLAEQSGLIKPLAYYVLAEAIQQCRKWHEVGIMLNMAVNLSTENLRDPKLVEVVTTVLDQQGVDATYLTVEITETAIMVDSQPARQTLASLHDMGVRIAIDDFGSGYSSLAYLKRLPVDEIKIDKSFVMEMDRHQDNAFIAHSVIDLSHNLGMEVVAEGVESREVQDMLTSMNCDHAQGFYFSHALPAADLTQWLRAPVGKRARITKIDHLHRTRQNGA